MGRASAYAEYEMEVSDRTALVIMECATKKLEDPLKMLRDTQGNLTKGSIHL